VGSIPAGDIARKASLGAVSRSMTLLSDLVKISQNSSIFAAKSVWKLSAPIINAGAIEKILQNDPWDAPRRG
jgi:hypothetical protein